VQQIEFVVQQIEFVVQQIEFVVVRLDAKNDGFFTGLEARNPGTSPSANLNRFLEIRRTFLDHK